MWLEYSFKQDEELNKQKNNEKSKYTQSCKSMVKYILPCINFTQSMWVLTYFYDFK